MKYMLFTAYRHGRKIGEIAGARINLPAEAPKARRAFPGADRLTVDVIEDGASKLQSGPKNIRLVW